MEIALTLFVQLTDKAFKTANRYFNADARKAYYSRWQDYCANGTQRLFATGDIKTAQAMYCAAVVCGFLPQFCRAVVPYIPFAFKRSEGFSGKIQKPKRDVLLTLDAHGRPTWETEMREKFDNENAPKEPAAFILRKRLDAVIKKERGEATDSSHTDTEIRKMLNELLKEYPVIAPESDNLSGTAQELVMESNAAKNKAEDAALASAA